MKLVKSASGKTIVKMSKSEWQGIGRKAGWLKKANDMHEWMQQYEEQRTKRGRFQSLIGNLGWFGRYETTIPEVSVEFAERILGLCNEIYDLGHIFYSPKSGVYFAPENSRLGGVMNACNMIISGKDAGKNAVSKLRGELKDLQKSFSEAYENFQQGERDFHELRSTR